VGQHKGHDIDAQVSRELLVSLFIPEGVNKLHDGAVIIRNLRVAKAGVFFPMPEGRVVDPSFGSRHRAALGITEETDAVVVIVSEERGTISFCFNGNIATNLDGPKLRSMLEAIFSPKVRKSARKAPKRIETPVPVDTAGRGGGAAQSPPSSRREPEIKPRRASDPDIAHPRISLVADQAEVPPVSRRSRSASDAPPPLRPSVTGTATPPPVGGVAGGAPIRTPVTGKPLAGVGKEEEGHDRDTPSDGGES
jgi:hypothetical protein